MNGSNEEKMAENKKSNTKERILKSAARLFSEKGYDKVTTREIAKDVGINPATLYYHFTSKEDVLKSLYDYYSREQQAIRPDLNVLLEQAKTEPPLKVLQNATFHFDEDKQLMIDQIKVTAVRRLGSDSASEDFIRDHTFGIIREIIQPLIERLIELRKIEPINVDIFIDIFSHYNFSVGILNRTSLGHNLEQYYSSMAWLFSLIVPIEE
jgi:AcrR family transcriptional regulator